jgi:gluconate 2-dehydrogenase gamma chain
VHSGGHGAFLNDEDSATVAAFAERIIPGAPGKPGATDAGVLNYIDLALAGALRLLSGVRLPPRIWPIRIR